MFEAEPNSERALIHAPTGRDASIATRILASAGYRADVAADVGELSTKLVEGAGLALIAEEALMHVSINPLSELLNNQPPWSDFPVVLLTIRSRGHDRSPLPYRIANILGNVILLERPFHPSTLASVVGTAIRGRRRQYEARNLLVDLIESEQQLQTALTAGHLGSWSLDIKTMALKTSLSCRQHFGRPDDNFSYLELLSCVHPDDRKSMRAALKNALASGDDYAAEYRNTWPDGSTHWIEMRARAVKDTAGTISQLIGVSSDISPRKLSESVRNRLLRELAVEREALSDLTATLEHRVQERTQDLMNEVQARERVQEQLLQSQKMESIGKLTGGVAHDFNNLLMAVMGNLELLRKRLPDDPRTRRLINGAIQGAERGAALTQRMLAFARQQNLKTDSAELTSLLFGMRDLLERTLGPQVALQFEVASDLPYAQVDAQQIELAILNLAINARDAMPSGGTITITNGTTKDAPSHLRPGGYLWIKVSDTGFGMDKQTLKMAIEPFFSTKPVGKGTGLGLSMVHGLAVQLGGSLEISSEPGQGTSATLWLPVSTKSERAIEPKAVVAAPSGKSAKILLVDDDPLIAMSVLDMLEDLGHRVLEANSGKRALEILDAEPDIDLLLTDHAMPGMTGTELAAIAQSRRPSLPVLLATGYADLPNNQKSTLPRLSKPYLQSQLMAELNRLLTPQR